MKALLYRRLQLAFALFVLLLLLALGMLAGIGWRNQARLEQIGRGIGLTHSLQRAGLDLRHLQWTDVTGAAAAPPAALRAIAADLAPLARPGVLLVPENAARLQAATAALTDETIPATARLGAALERLRQTSFAEIDAVGRLMAGAERGAAVEAAVSLGALLLLPILLALARWRLARGVFRPIGDLTDLLTRLGQGEPRPIPLGEVDPLLLPLLTNYNATVARLAELEAAHRAHAEALEAEVRVATGALLAQHQSLARAERLAAAGEVAAAVAHELRNPLAGIQLALTNLREDLRDPQAQARLDLVTAEIARMGRLLRDLLEQARMRPEAPRDLDLGVLVGELLTLVRYQAPPGVRLAAAIPPGLTCRLPDHRLRQALLNLVLNAIEAQEAGGGEVRVSAERSGERVRLAVSDAGPGFPPPVLATPLQPFRSGRPAGTGLGLAMVYRFARDLGGRLELSNREPHGACATLILPCETHP